MATALIVEDLQSKKDSIALEIEIYFGKENVNIEWVDNFSAATKRIYEAAYDIIIVDLLLPRRHGENEADVSDEIIDHIQDSEKNAASTVVAISQFEDVVEEKRKRFVEAGIVLVHFDKPDGSWKASLNVCLQRIERKLQVDFVIICALEKERNAFQSTNCQIGELTVINGLDCLRLRAGNMEGVCIKLPRMGLVDATAISARAIEVFSPKVIAMAGICGGFSDEVQVGTIIVSDVCWEHQAGKWANEVFKLEHYQIGIENKVRALLSQMIEREGNFSRIKQNLINDCDVLNQGVLLKPTVTGSVVIASTEKLDNIKSQHRKVAGLDMEMYGLYRASDLSTVKPICFGAKTVVDLADSAKGDTFHIYGCVISARFIVEALLAVQKGLLI
ncbi:response regulator [Agrobacterium sp. ICMP 7243]|uniref:phosphorylase family protein n=1 Tax=Rhizobium rhizogenes TaxID=359 RepID=UPI00064698F7|nr:response regulator [Rhizobium rhizogenes]KAA6489931.1 response regulator [Agrobacterium sp. ICMP 7243]